MYPHERSLVTKMQSKPFALLGVNADQKLDDAKKAVKENQLDWRSFWDGPKGPEGPIAHSWGVHGWPSGFVLDRAGRIRYKYPEADALDKAVETLLAEMQPAGGGR